MSTAGCQQDYVACISTRSVFAQPANWKQRGACKGFWRGYCAYDWAQVIVFTKSVARRDRGFGRINYPTMYHAMPKGALGNSPAC